ncbi:MAG TPA: radical SAM protein [Actinomycetes bacterium]|jgi:MoaA/NifB/PqqE/SkfB family radical SAM enzyme|nr:radical SAM protein [Actinomycetes bacterium]
MTTPLTSSRTAPPAGILILSLASACACRCVFCGLPETRPHTVLERDTLTTALDGTPTAGPWREVNLTGGDPLVVPAARALFPDVLVRRHKFARLSVNTAGVPAEAALRGLRLLEGTPLDLYVSLDGVGRLHDRIRGRAGAFTEVDRFLDECRGLTGVQLALTCVINRYNAEHLDAVADYAAGRGIPVSYAIVNSSDHYIRSLPMYGDVSLTQDQLDPVTDFLVRRSTQRLDDDLRAVLNGGRRQLPCRLLHEGVLVTSDGTVSICGTSQQMILGHLDTVDGSSLTWQALLARRSALLAKGARATCDTCTSNCFAWRKSDEPVTA